MPQAAAAQPEVDLAQSIRDLKAQVDAKQEAFREMTTRRKETQNELVTLVATFDDEMTRLSAELGDHLAANDVVKQVASEKQIFSLRGKREKLEAHLAAYDSSLDKQRRALTELGHELRGMEQSYWSDLFEQHRSQIDVDHLMLVWALSCKSGVKSDNIGEYLGRLCGGVPGGSARNPANVEGLSERVESLSPYMEKTKC